MYVCYFDVTLFEVALEITFSNTTIFNTQSLSLSDSYLLQQYPYSWPEDDPGHQILHSIESAEKSVVHAVNDEVKNFFHGPSKHHDDHDEVQKAHKVLERGLKKTTKHLDEAHEHRREWFKDGNLIEEYNQLNFL